MTHERPYDDLVDRLDCVERRLRQLECDTVVARLQALADLIGRSHHEVIKRLDAIAAGGSTEQAERLRELAEKLGSMGALPDVPLTPKEGT